MPFPTPPAYVENLPSEQTPLMSEMVKRAAQQNPINVPQAPQLSQPSTPSIKWPMIANLIGGAADVLTTQRGLSQGGVEMNPLLPQGRLANGLALGGSYVANALISKLLNDHGHPKIAKALSIAGAIDGGASALHNLGLFKLPGER